MAEVRRNQAIEGNSEQKTSGPDTTDAAAQWREEMTAVSAFITDLENDLDCL